MTVDEPEADPRAPLAPDDAARIDALVGRFVEGALAPWAGAARRAATEVGRLGEREILATTHTTARLLDGPLRAVGGALDGRADVSRALADLREAIDELDPARYDLASSAPRRLLGFVPLPDRLTDYFGRYDRAQGRLRALIATLTEERAGLIRENAVIEQATRSLAAQVAALDEYAAMAGRIDEALAARIDALEAAGGDPERARLLRADVLFSVRQRRQAILTHLAVVTQGQAALHVVTSTNDQLIRAIEAAVSTTVTALRTAAVVARALTRQRLAVHQVKAATDIARDVAVDAAALQRVQAVRARRRVSGGAGLETLEVAWHDAAAALEDADRSRKDALEAIREAGAD